MKKQTLPELTIEQIYHIYEPAGGNPTQAKKLLAEQGIRTSTLTIKRYWEKRNLEINLTVPGGDRGNYRKAALPDEKELRRLYYMYEGNVNKIALNTKYQPEPLKRELIRLGLLRTTSLEEKVE
ncbi:MAG: hypothetical protein WC595_01715 [Candidatus Nanoarchaeia archaeon]